MRDDSVRSMPLVTRRRVLGTSLALAAAPLLAPLPTAAAAQEATPVSIDPEVPFAEVDGTSLLLDLYRPPARDAARPAVLVFPGYGAGREYLAPNAQALAAAGYVAAVADYRASFATFVDDARLAARWVRANAPTYGVDPERLGAYGHSAGGQLAVLLGTRGTPGSATPVADPFDQVTCSVSVAGVGDVSVVERDTDRLPIALEITGLTSEQLLDGLRDKSPAALVDGQNAPAMLLHGGADEVLSPEQSWNLAAALQAAGVETVHVFLPGVGHGPIVEWELGEGLVLAFLRRHLRPDE
jgi:acetyl esterase/lipase